jgi:hypothetical protein
LIEKILRRQLPILDFDPEEEVIWDEQCVRVNVIVDDPIDFSHFFQEESTQLWSF